MITETMELNMKEQEQVHGGFNPVTGMPDVKTGAWDGLIGKPLDGLVMGGVVDGSVLGVLKETNH